MTPDAPAPSPLLSHATERALRLLLATLALSSVLVFAIVAWLSYRSHFAEAQSRLARGVDILTEQSAKVFETLDLVAGRVDELLGPLTDAEITAREPELFARIKAIVDPLEQVQFVLVLDAQAHQLLFTASLPAVRSAGYDGRDYVEALRRGAVPAGQSVVSAVLQGRVRTDNTTFLVATYRGAAAPPAPFRGVIALSTRPAYFVEHFRQIAGADINTVTLLREDGAVLARYPGQINVAAHLASSSAFMAAIARAPQQGAYEAVSALDHVQRLFAYRHLPHHPVYVTAGIDRASVLAAWRATLEQYLLFGVPPALGLGVLALTALRRARGEALAVAQLAERTRELDRVWETSRDLFAVGGRDLVLRAANPAWGDALGFPLGEVIGQKLVRFVHPDDSAALSRAVARLTGGEVARDIDLRMHARDGAERWFSWTCVPEGEVFYAAGHDITERRQLAERLRQAQKMEAVGQLTGGIAHDFNNMLAVVIGSLDLLERRLGPEDRRARRHVETATDGARRAALLTQRMLAFARQQPLRPQPVDANALISGVSELIRGSLGSLIRLDTMLAANAWPIHADPNQLESALLNLAVNARDAMAAGGRLIIQTRNVSLDDQEAAARAGLSPGAYLSIAVIDDGIGMTPEVAARAFDPFFTTKEVGHGTGLGLSQVYGFVTQSGGHVAIRSQPGQGTTVEVLLPRRAGGPDQADRPAEASAALT